MPSTLLVVPLILVVQLLLLLLTLLEVQHGVNQRPFNAIVARISCQRSLIRLGRERKHLLLGLLFLSLINGNQRDLHGLIFSKFNFSYKQRQIIGS